jgi:hypothetical protein
MFSNPSSQIMSIANIYLLRKCMLNYINIMEHSLFYHSQKLKTTAGNPSRELTGSFFAEFLHEVSPVHLGALTPTHLCRFAVRLPKS